MTAAPPRSPPPATTSLPAWSSRSARRESPPHPRRGGNRQRARVIAGALIALIAACRRDTDEQRARPAQPAVQLAPADVATAREATIETGPLISGTLEAAKSATVRAQIGGAVRRVGPEVGQSVAARALLAEIDPRGLGDAAASARAQLASAQAQLDVARREAERSHALVAAGAIARRDLETAESRVAAQRAAVDQARAQLATAAKQLSDATVRAPIAGVVAQRAINVGDVVSPGATLYQILDPSSIRLSASVPSDELGAIALGQDVRFTVHGYRDEIFTGRIARIAPSADPATRQIAILVEMPNPTHRLLVGLFARGRIAARRVTGVVVPLSAIDTRTTPPAVLRIRGDTVERVAVGVGLGDPLRDEVAVTGVAAGDRILARATAAPPPGSQVTLPPAS